MRQEINEYSPQRRKRRKEKIIGHGFTQMKEDRSRKLDRITGLARIED